MAKVFDQNDEDIIQLIFIYYEKFVFHNPPPQKKENIIFNINLFVYFCNLKCVGYFIGKYMQYLLPQNYVYYNYYYKYYLYYVLLIYYVYYKYYCIHNSLRKNRKKNS